MAFMDYLGLNSEELITSNPHASFACASHSFLLLGTLSACQIWGWQISNSQGSGSTIREAPPRAVRFGAGKVLLYFGRKIRKCHTKVFRHRKPSCIVVHGATPHRRQASDHPQMAASPTAHTAMIHYCSAARRRIGAVRLVVPAHDFPSYSRCSPSRFHLQMPPQSDLQTQHRGAQHTGSRPPARGGRGAPSRTWVKGPHSGTKSTPGRQFQVEKKSVQDDF